MLASVAERSSNFEEAFTKLYEATNDLQQGLELEKTDNIY